LLDASLTLELVKESIFGNILAGDVSVNIDIFFGVDVLAQTFDLEVEV
jgi:hypothetical protein